MEHTTIAVDLAKSVFQVAISCRAGRIDREKRLSRDRFLPSLAQQPPATGAARGVRFVASLGAPTRTGRPRGPALPAHDVHRYVRRNKTDRTDAKALLEAARNEEIHPVPIKTVEHQAITSLHGLRSMWLATRTARLNTLRGLLREFGIFIPVGAQHVVPRVRELLREPTAVPELMRTTLASTCDEIGVLETNMRAVERQLTALARQLPDVTLLQTIPGVGLLTATALIALVGNVQRFDSGRHFASVLGLTPKEDSSALRRRLGAISKQGDVYLRMLLIHGARSFLWHAKRGATRTRRRRGRERRSSAAATMSPPSRWRTNSRASFGPCGDISGPLPSTPAHSPDRLNSPEDCIELT